jgi:hypothetical protein
MNRARWSPHGQAVHGASVGRAAQLTMTELKQWQAPQVPGRFVTPASSAQSLSSRKRQLFREEEKMRSTDNRYLRRVP